jgi:hypothetical protein
MIDHSDENASVCSDLHYVVHSLIFKGFGCEKMAVDPQL